VKKKLVIFSVSILIGIILVVGYVKWQAYAQAPYVWIREGNTYTNACYGLQITRTEGWLRYQDDESLGSRYFSSRMFHNPALLLFPKRNLIEFRKIGEDLKPEASVLISPVDDLKGKFYGRSPLSYARFSLGTVIASQSSLKKGDVELTELNGEPSARSRISINVLGAGEVESECYFFVNNGMGFSLGYSSTPSKFNRYRSEAVKIVQSFRFIPKTAPD